VAGLRLNSQLHSDAKTEDPASLQRQLPLRPQKVTAIDDERFVHDEVPLLVLRVQEHSPERTIFDQIAHCLCSLGQREDSADRRLQRAFLQELQ